MIHYCPCAIGSLKVVMSEEIIAGLQKTTISVQNPPFWLLCKMLNKAWKRMFSNVVLSTENSILGQIYRESNRTKWWTIMLPFSILYSLLTKELMFLSCSMLKFKQFLRSPFSSWNLWCCFVMLTWVIATIWLWTLIECKLHKEEF